ncbi:MAG: glycosyltransferase family 9 protein [bacterium]|nr:glycosyltransferase family 9 protein [bacterium]
MNLDGKRIIVSRTDSIGDVMLTLPICHWIKQQAPSAHIIFLGKGYTKSVVEAYNDVDQFEDWADYAERNPEEQLGWLKSLQADVILHVFPKKELATLAKKAKLPVRIGTSHRLYHLLSCTHRVNFTRKKSDLHESQLNFELLRPLGLTKIPTLRAVSEATQAFQPKEVVLPEPFQSLENFVILHPKSQGSAREWPTEKYIELAEKLMESGKNVVFTGTENEGKLFRDQLPNKDSIYDSTGKLSLEQLITLIGKSIGLIACSTGPLHIAGYSGVRAVGLFSPQRPIHPGRWKALGSNVQILVCPEGSSTDASTNCLEEITVQSAFDALTL